ncbi:MAG: hypothetical protein Q3971_00585 [Moraxella sp.]|nr:hypothetical protein [Moraxella sp.]
MNDGKRKDSIKNSFMVSVLALVLVAYHDQSANVTTTTDTQSEHQATDEMDKIHVVESLYDFDLGRGG